MSKIYVPLHLHTPSSLLEGACRPEEIAARAVELGLPAVAMTDTSTLAGIAAFSKAMTKAGIQPIAGAQIDVEDDEAAGPIVLLACNKSGWDNLVSLVNKAACSESRSVSLDDIVEKENGLICLTGSGRGLLSGATPAATISILARLQAAMGSRLYIQIERVHGDDAERERENRLLDAGASLGIAVAAANETFFVEKDMAEAHDALLCIGESSHVAAADRRKTVPDAYLRDAEEMSLLFADIPEALENTIEIAKRCSHLFAGAKPMLPAFPSEDGRSEADELATQARNGLAERLAAAGLAGERAAYEARLDYEIGVICDMGFPGYFLIVSDFIKWAKARGIAVGPGRGSGAGSLVAWSLKITDLDPIRYGLLFERFLNPDRVSMPDFDVDFEQARREEVIDYVRRRYGDDKVVQIGTYGKLQARGVVRDTARVLQIPYPVADRYARMIPNNPTAPVTLAEAITMEPLADEFAKADASVKKLFDIALKLEGLYRHASTHAAGVVICDRPVSDIVPLMKDAHGALITQYDMKAVEEAGLVKFDFLGLKTLDVIEETRRLAQAAGDSIALPETSVDDAKTYEMLANGDSFGVFQLESAGMRQAMRQIETTSIEDLIALVSLYRPGPMENIPAYAEVKKGERRTAYLHPAMEEILSETNGIIIYQEQVMELARKLAGYTLGQADLLRRAMGKKIKIEMDAQREVFLNGAAANGIETHIATRIFDLIARFADYGFNKSHAAAYALIAYRTAWLKRHHPAAFMAATMNLELHDSERLAIIADEARRQRIALLPPCVNRSETKFRIEKTGKKAGIRYALAGLKALGESQTDIVIRERKSNGQFVTFEDLVRRTGLNKRAVEVLIKAGACDGFGHTRAAMIAALPSVLGQRRDEAKRDIRQSSLFDTLLEEDTAGAVAPMAEFKRIDLLNNEYAALGLYLSGHPMELASGKARSRSTLPLARATDPLSRIKGEIRIGAMLSKLKVKTDKSNRPMAILSLSDQTGLGEAMAFDEDYDRVSSILAENRAFIFTVGVSTREGQRRLYIRNAEPVELH